ncbi:hypothetical protein [Geobacillus genomosp. 3]|uniref:hypothetical protein n=1 Tax=Geobacillus genomosp. 3 TaxID=1921421 RepID=UPI00042528A3|nr:hypothetical protein [Geobacillus genomosp. 3]
MFSWLNRLPVCSSNALTFVHLTGSACTAAQGESANKLTASAPPIIFFLSMDDLPFY